MKIQKTKAIFLIFLFSVGVACQTPNGVSDECVVSVIKYPNAASVNSEELKSRAIEIGKFETTVYEGASTRKRFKIPGSKLFVFANIFYDDDIYFDDDLQEAMTLTLAVSQSRKETLWSGISMATTQIQHDEHFSQTSLVTLARVGNKWFDVSMICSKKARP